MVTFDLSLTESAWMECDDLKSPVSQFQKCPLKVPAEQIHIVMWESLGMSDAKEAGGTKPKVRKGRKTAQKGRRKSPPAKSTSTVKIPTQKEADTANCKTENFVPPSALKPNMVVTLTPTGQIIQMPPAPQIPSPLPTSSRHLLPVGNFSQNSANGTELKTINSNNQVNHEVKTLPTNPISSPQMYTTDFLKSLIQRKSRKTHALQVENKMEKPLSALGGANTKVQGTSSTSFRAPYAGKKKFEGYFSHKISKTDISQGSPLVRSASVYSMSGDSTRPSSPTLSSYSDTFTMKKRKKGVKKQDPKRRKSICTSVSSPESLPSEEVVNVPKSEGCDILQSLYSALNIAMPENSELTNNLTLPPVDLNGEDFIPDVKDLADFIASPGNHASSNFDDFLAEL
jgi:hypothetical protein